MTIYAKWSVAAQRRTITYLNADGTQIGVDTYYASTEDQYILRQGPTVEGFRFIGWFDATDTSKIYECIPAGTDKNLTLKARMEDESKFYHSLSYYVDGKYHGMEKFVEDEGLAALATPSKGGYTFDGWYADASCTGEKVTSITAGTTTDQRLYGKFIPNEYTIKYFDGLTEAELTLAPNTYSTSADAVALPTITTKKGYTIEGWYNEAGEKMTEIPAGYYGDLVLTAVYTPEVYTITYVLYGGENNENNVDQYTYDPEGSVPTLEDPTRDGYLFAGWYTNPEFTGEAVTEIPETSTGDVKLYAKWTKLYNAITYVFNGGATTENCPDRHTTGTATKIPQSVTKSGAQFVGWYDNPSFSGDPVTEIPAEYDGDVTLYARFSALILNADFDGNSYNEKEGSVGFFASMTGTANNQAEWISPSDANGNDGYLSVYNDGLNGTQNQYVSITNMSLAGYYTVTFEFDIWADLVNGTVAAPKFYLRTYTAGGSPFNVFDCFANGNIQVAGKSLGTLTTERSHVKIELTIAPDGTATAVGQLNDGEAVTSTFSCPNKGVSELTNAQFYFGGKTVVNVDGTDVAPKIYLDNVKITAQ